MSKIAVETINIDYEWVGRFEDTQLTPMLVGAEATVLARFTGGIEMNGDMPLLSDEMQALQAVLVRIAARVEANMDALMDRHGIHRD